MRCVLLATVSGFALFSTAAFAQDAPPPAAPPPAASPPATPAADTAGPSDAAPPAAQKDDQGFGDIIVTAQRRSDTLQRVPMAVSAITDAALSRGAVSSLIDIQNTVPNVNISARASSGVVAIRGIGFDIVTAGAEGSVALHSDGVYQSRPTAALAGLFDIERIEVARGPQGTLYGRNATGGAINIITKKPTDTFEGYVNAGYGNYNAYNAQGAISGPIAPGLLDFRIAGKIEGHDGYGTNVFNNTPVDDLRDYALRGELSFTPSSAVKFLLIADYFHRNDHSYPTRFAGCLLAVCNANAGVSRGFPVPSDLRDVSVDVGPINRQSLGGVNLTTTIDLSFATLTSISAYRTGTSYYLFDLDGTALPGSFSTREENHHEFSQELQLGNKGNTFDWIAGLYYFYENNYARSNGHFPTFLTPAGFSTYFQGGLQKTNAYAGFGELSWHGISGLTLTLGGRYSNERKNLIDEFTFTNGPVNITARQPAPTAAIPCVVCRGLPDQVSFSSFTPKFAASYQIDSDRMLYATVQKGFKSGGFAIGAVTPAFQPEEIWSYEAGLKASWFDHRLITNISYYHYDYSNLQVGRVQSVALVITNAGKVKVDGVEFEVRAKLGDHIELNANGAYNDARFTSYMTANPAINPAQVLDLSGNLLSNAPKWTGNLGAEYHTAAFGGRISVRGDVFASSRVFFSPYNNLINSQAPYTIKNASIRYDSGDKSWFASVYMNNISNDTIKAGSFVTTLLTGGFVNASLLPPRTFGATIGFNF